MNAHPSIIISEQDAERLEALFEDPSNQNLPGKTDLEAELGRAEIRDSRNMPPNVVTMNSTVQFKVSSSEERFRLTLVYPKDMDDSGERISILAPVGSALLGLSVGDEIEWPGPGQGIIKVSIEDILYQPERAGEYHR